MESEGIGPPELARLVHELRNIATPLQHRARLLRAATSQSEIDDINAPGLMERAAERIFAVADRMVAAGAREDESFKGSNGTA